LHSTAISQSIAESQTLEEHEGYHQAITGREAEKRLRKNGGHCYLTRYSKFQKCYILSIHKAQKHSRPVIEHFKIIIEGDGKHKIDGKDKTFDGIKELLEYYEGNRIDPALKSIGQPYTEDAHLRSRKCKVQ
jgi:hypothetical protein